MKQVIIDLETLGLKERAVVLSLGAVVFDFEAPVSYDTLVRTGIYIKFDAKEQIQKYGRTTTKSTLDWWRGQSAEAKEVLQPTPLDYRMVDGLNDFNAWLSKCGYDYKKSFIWSRGSYFDFPKLEDMFDQAEITCGFNGWKIRDIRTMIDCLTGSEWGKYDLKDGTPSTFVHHNALHDAALDAARMLEIFKELS